MWKVTSRHKTHNCYEPFDVLYFSPDLQYHSVITYSFNVATAKWKKTIIITSGPRANIPYITGTFKYLLNVEQRILKEKK